MLDPTDIQLLDTLLDKKIDQNSLFLPKINPNEEYVVHKQHRPCKSKFPPFAAYAGGRYMIDPTKSLLSKLGHMNASERWFFIYLHEHLDYTTNIAKIRNSDLTSSQQAYKIKAFKSLHEQDMVKRIQREYYMINPDWVIPIPGYPAAKEYWNTLT
jgi:hypothetical protein